MQATEARSPGAAPASAPGNAINYDLMNLQLQEANGHADATAVDTQHQIQEMKSDIQLQSGSLK